MASENSRWKLSNGQWLKGHMGSSLLAISGGLGTLRTKVCCQSQVYHAWKTLNWLELPSHLEPTWILKVWKPLWLNYGRICSNTRRANFLESWSSMLLWSYEWEALGAKQDVCKIDYDLVELGTEKENSHSSRHLRRISEWCSRKWNWRQW